MDSKTNAESTRVLHELTGRSVLVNWFANSLASHQRNEYGPSHYRDAADLIAQLDRELLARGLAAPGDRLVPLMSTPTRAMAPTNAMMVRACGDPFESAKT